MWGREKGLKLAVHDSRSDLQQWGGAFWLDTNLTNRNTLETVTLSETRCDAMWWTKSKHKRTMKNWKSPAGRPRTKCLWTVESPCSECWSVHWLVTSSRLLYVKTATLHAGEFTHVTTTMTSKHWKVRLSHDSTNCPQQPYQSINHACDIYLVQFWVQLCVGLFHHRLLKHQQQRNCRYQTLLPALRSPMCCIHVISMLPPDEPSWVYVFILSPIPSQYDVIH